MPLREMVVCWAEGGRLLHESLDLEEEGEPVNRCVVRVRCEHLVTRDVGEGFNR